MNPLKARLAAGETIKAAWVELGSPDVAEIMVRHGWDVIVIDGARRIECAQACLPLLKEAGVIIYDNADWKNAAASTSCRR